MVPCKGARSAGTEPRAGYEVAEHGEYPPLAWVLSVCWLSYQAKVSSAGYGMIPLIFGESERSEHHAACGGMLKQACAGQRPAPIPMKSYPATSRMHSLV